MTKNELLIEELKKEHARLPEKDFFGVENHKEQYKPIYEFLTTGETCGNHPEWDLYSMVISEIETVYEDYLGD